MIQRPAHLRLNTRAPLATGLVFAGLAPGGLVGSTLYPDSSLYGRNGTLTKGPTWAYDSTLDRWIVNMAGGDDVIVVPSISLPVPYSLSMWLYWTGTPYTSLIASDSTTNQALYVNSTAYATNVAGDYKEILRSTTLNTWTHMSFQRDAGKAYLWINGTYINSVNTSNTTAATITRIGNRSDEARGCKGKITDVLFHSRLLGVGEIQQLADPSNTLLSGLILPPRRKLWPVATSGTYSTTIEMPVFQLTI